jgi:hypothetical protein
MLFGKLYVSCVSSVFQMDPHTPSITFIALVIFSKLYASYFNLLPFPLLTNLYLSYSSRSIDRISQVLLYDTIG